MSASYGRITGEISSFDSGFSGIVFGSESPLKLESFSDGSLESGSVMDGSGS